MLKLAYEPVFSELITLDQFQSVAYLLVVRITPFLLIRFDHRISESSLLHDCCLQDPVYKVREIFSQKLHKGLMSLRLPLQYLSIFCLTGQDVEKDLKVQVKGYLQSNINKRRDLLRTSAGANGELSLKSSDVSHRTASS